MSIPVRGWTSLSAFSLAFLLTPGLLQAGDATSYGVYPITASWFRDRYTAQEWNHTLHQFSSIGGDTVWQRAPALQIRSKPDILADPDFTYCNSYKRPAGIGPPDCVTEAETELTQAGLKIAGLATYQYDEDFSSKILVCPKYEKVINSSRIYHRLVLPVITSRSGDTCSLRAGDAILVVFAVFSGIDPHALLLQQASIRNMSVYFGLPAAPSKRPGYGEFYTDLLPAYYEFVRRIVVDHQYRYSSSYASSFVGKNRFEKRPLYDTLVGYYAPDEVCLAQLSESAGTSQGSVYLGIYTQLAKRVRAVKKKVAISPYILLNKYMTNYTMSQHVEGLTTLGKTRLIDIIAVQEGRGCGKGSYYWPNQTNTPIVDIDPVLDQIVHFLNPEINRRSTYNETFIASNNELFRGLAAARDRLNINSTSPVEFWLNVESFEYLRDDPCLPVDVRGSGMAELLDRTTKSRLDWAISVAGSRVNRIITFAWDADWTCATRSRPQSLLQEVIADIERPIIAECRWHSSANMSIVIIGFGLLGETQAFHVDYPLREGTRSRESAFGYYYETDYGLEHGLVPSLSYIMLFDVWNPFDIAEHGYVWVSAEDAHQSCYFEY